MTTASNSTIIIAPQDKWNELRKFLKSQGYDIGEGNRLSATGDEPATHRGAHAMLTDKQAREFTLRDVPKSFDKYTIAEAQTCMESFSTREDGESINYGLMLDDNRNSDIVIANTTKGLSTPRERYEAALIKRGLQEILVDAEPAPLSGQAAKVLGTK